MAEHPEKTYSDGDAVVEHVGLIQLTDGREFMGVILTFPVNPPPLPFSASWDGTPIKLTLGGFNPPVNPPSSNVECNKPRGLSVGEE